MMRRGLLAIALIALSTRAFVACGGNVVSSSAPADASLFDGGDANAGAISANCPDTGDAPATFACTGLYVDIAAKTLAPGIREYAPAVPLWADTAEKGRWIALPDGTTIDGTSPNEWTFPVGTRVWKEFRLGSKRIETRFFVKLRPTYWAHATYVWNGDESDAIRSFGADIALAGGAKYHVPSPTECDQCHKGRTDRILGFEAALLGLPGATGLNLAALAAEGRITPAPSATTLAIGDDGTGADAPALAWLHVNCGVSCHNGNSNATGYGTGLRLRLDATQLDGRPASGWDSLTTTENAAARSPAWNGEVRIVPGDPDASLLVRLVGTRSSDGQGQMPPLATREVDQADLAAIEDWIRKMPHAVVPDAGPIDASGDANDASDAGDASDASDAPDAPDAGPIDGGSDAVDASRDASPDATLDGGTTDPDAGAIDPDAANDAGNDGGNDADAASADDASGDADAGTP